MNGARHSKTEFSIGQYLNDLQKYENRLRSKSKGLKKDSSSSSMKKDFSSTIYSSKPPKDFKMFQKTTKYQLNEKQQNVHKLCLEKKSETKQKIRFRDEHYKFHVDMYPSIDHSTITQKTKTIQSYHKEDNESIQFSQKQQRIFIDECCKLYNLKNSAATLENISKEIDKRDEVYHVIQKNLKISDKVQIGETLEMFFDQFELMKEIVQEFKKVSKLEIENLNELYYFLKSDR